MRVLPKTFDQCLDLVVGHAVPVDPGAPLVAVEGPDRIILIGPVIPDVHVQQPEPVDVLLAAEEPEELGLDDLHGDVLGGDPGESRLKVVPQLTAEDGASADAGAILAGFAVKEDVFEKSFVLVVDLGHQNRPPRSTTFNTRSNGPHLKDACSPYLSRYWIYVPPKPSG